ncbi:MAG: 3-phosphoshikimate 1-carboxyvinyltransferase [Candidatus Nanohalobium sp.]
MKAKIGNSEVSGTVSAPPSKSYTHRAVLAGLYADELEVKDPLMSADPRASIRCAESLGAEVEELENSLKIEGVDGEPETPENILDCGNSGTTLRLFTGAAALAEKAAVLTGDKSLVERPNNPLIETLNDLGAETFSTKYDGAAPLVVNGKISSGDTCIDGTVSSQFISSLLFCMPLTDEGGRLEIEGELKSRPYVDITIEVLEDMGVEINDYMEGFEIPGGQSYSSEEFQVPGDFSSASYPLAAGALAGKVRVENLYPSAQGDERILDVLERMGAEVDWNTRAGVAEVSEGVLEGIKFDASDNPDLVPTVAVLASQASGRTEIVNAEHLRFKETDRLEAMATELSIMGAEVEEGEDYLVIDGDRSELEGGEVDGRDDHRVVMALALAGLAAEGETVVDTAECVEISYPGFFSDLEDLGVQIEEAGKIT